MNRSRCSRLFCLLFLIVEQLAVSSAPACAQLSESELAPAAARTLPIRLKDAATRQLKPVDKQTMEDLFRKASLRYTDAPPLDLGKLVIPGLTPQGAEHLAINHFVVSTGTTYKKLSDIYAENRAEGKANFVTADSILHPYFAFTNTLLGSVIEESLNKDLKELLKAMIASSMVDYRETGEDEVKDDIQRNLAYLSVALKLLDPKSPLPDIGGAAQLVDKDFALVESGKKGHSMIFGLDEDFSAYRPWGMMTRSERLRRYHRAYQWLSRMDFPLSNITNNSLEGGGNSFRRAMLLYRSLMLAKLPNEAPLDRWNRIATITALTGFDINAKRKTIIAPELSGVVKTSVNDLDGLLRSLGQPFLRTKLLLSVRKQRPVELNAKSIFEMGSVSDTAGDDVVFRLFPLTDPPELDWLRETAHNFVEPAQGPNPLPLGLLSLHGHGMQQATNVLADQMDTLDKSLSVKVPRLERLVRVVGSDPNQKMADRHWNIVSCLLRAYPDSAQIATRSEMWMNRQLESAIAAWIDSYCAYEPPTVLASPPGAVDSKNTAEPDKTSQKVRPASFQYLEPRTELYKLLDYDLQNLVYQLATFKVLPERFSARSKDFQRLFQRLVQISDRETKQEPISVSDFQLLANIDKILEPVDSPIASNIYLDAAVGDTKPEAAAKPADDSPIKLAEVKPDPQNSRPSNSKSLLPPNPKDPINAAETRTGATLGVGRAGRLFIICNTSQGLMLARGAMYTYYETAGGPLKDEHWERKLTYSTILPPFWTRQFDLVQGDVRKDANLGSQLRIPSRFRSPTNFED